MKKNSTALIVLVLSSFLLGLAACGTESTTETASPDGNSSAEAESTIPDSETTTTTVNSSDDSGDWVATDDNLTNFQPSDEATVEVNPENPTSVIVSFEAGAAPCSGGRAMATETSDAVTVTVETGIHSNSAAMSCIAVVETHQVILELQSELGDRSLSIAQAN